MTCLPGQVSVWSLWLRSQVGRRLVGEAQPCTGHVGIFPTSVCHGKSRAFGVGPSWAKMILSVASWPWTSYMAFLSLSFSSKKKKMGANITYFLGLGRSRWYRWSGHAEYLQYSGESLFYFAGLGHQNSLFPRTSGMCRMEQMKSECEILKAAHVVTSKGAFYKVFSCPDPPSLCDWLAKTFPGIFWERDCGQGISKVMRKM